jgi:uncharacterized membrane protein YdjX (TVP38/TMEM64 family)
MADEGPRVGVDDSGDGDRRGRDGRRRRPKGPRVEVVLQNGALILAVLVMVWLAFHVKLPSLDEMRDRIEGLGWAAWLGYIGLYAVVALTPIPVTIMAVVGGVLFGVLEGSVLAVIGSVLGCWGGYWIARLVGRAPIMRLLGSHAETVEGHLDHGGFSAVFMLRVLPGMPYWPVNYGAGALGVTQRGYMIATMIACIPGQVSLVSIGHFVSSPGIMAGIVLAAAWAVVIVLTIWAWRSVKGTSSRALPGAQRAGRARTRATDRSDDEGPADDEETSEDEYPSGDGGLGTTREGPAS